MSDKGYKFPTERERQLNLGKECVWLVVGLCVFGFLVGTPHYRTNVRCQTFDGRTCFRPKACTYIGIQGMRNVEPGAGIGEDACPSITVLPLK